MADLVDKVEKTALQALRRALWLLGEGLEFGGRLVAKISSRATRREGPRAKAAGRQEPLNQAKEEERGKEELMLRGSAPPMGQAGREEARTQPLPEGHLVARMAGEGEVFRAPLPLAEEKLASPPPVAPGPPPLPHAYHDDAFVALARDPYTLWLYWDFSKETVRAAVEGLRWPRTKLRIYQGEHRVRDLDFALESGSYYINDLSPGEEYQAEIVFVGQEGERRLGQRSNPVKLPNFGPASVAGDLFATLPWEARLPKGLDAFERPFTPGELDEHLQAVRGPSRRGASDAWPRWRPKVSSGSFLGRGAGRGGR